MNSLLLLATVFVAVLSTVLGLLFIARLLLGADLHRMRQRGFFVPPPTRDPLTLKDTLVQFFAHSKGAARVIRLLAARQKPIAYEALIDDIRFDEHWRRDSDPLPAAAILALLGTMQIVGLSRFSRRGFSITAVGRHVHDQMEPDSPAPLPRLPVVRAHSAKGVRRGDSLSSPDSAKTRPMERGSATYAAHD